MDNSFDENDSIDLASVVAEFPLGDDHPNERIPVKKLSSVFDGMVKPDDNSMKVYLRVRPFKGKEAGTITVDSDTSIITNAPEQSKRAQYTKMESRHYAFTRVFDQASAQDVVYEETTCPLFNRFLRGENAVMFAYGMTNAGKTYTIQGSNSNPGILPRLVTAVLDSMGTVSTQWDLHISMLEIYQENIYDLLSKKKKEKLTIRDANGKVEVNRLSTHSIKSTKEACKLMDTAAYNRSKSATFLNTGSSRSHAVYTITLDRSNEEGVFNESVSFQLVDLAGAERGNRTKATGAQQKEANNINMSLMQLWRCLQGMKKRNNSELGSSQEIIPFRESKLTHMLMPILNRAGMSGTAMIACVNPQSDDYDETLTILSNANIASKIKEIADVGRTAANHISSASTASNAAVAAAAQKKRRMESSSSAGTVASNATNNSNRVSNNTTTMPVLKKISKGPSKKVEVKVEVLSGNKRKADETQDQDQAETTEVKRLRVEVAALRESNMHINSNQLEREAEIRAEVAEEMALRSMHLLDQIQDLQSQLSTHEASASKDVTKSVRKERKRQMRVIAEDDEKDMQEVEDELQRMKACHEVAVEELRAENEALNMKIRALQTLQTSSVTSVPKVSKFSSVFALPQSSSSAGDENAPTNVNVNLVVKSPLKSPLKSPSRSPLGDVSKNTGNSPNRGLTSLASLAPKGYQNGTISAALKRIDSPLRPRGACIDAESLITYGTRTRSHIGRA